MQAPESKEAHLHVSFNAHRVGSSYDHTGTIGQVHLQGTKGGAVFMLLLAGLCQRDCQAGVFARAHSKPNAKFKSL